jgi:hypothetical protein
MTTPIKTRRDGSIDTAYYIAKGRLARSEAAHDAVRRAAPAKGRSPRGVLVPVLMVSIAMIALPFLA